MDTRFTGDIHLSTRQAADGDKLDFWLSEVDRLLVRVECDRRPEERLEASLDWQDFGLLRMATIRANQHAVTRSGHSLSRDGRDSIFACLMLQGEGFSHQGVECARHGPGDVVLYDTARPYGHGFPADMAMAVLDIPRPLFQEQVGVWNERGLVRIERAAGMDALAAPHRLLAERRRGRAAAFGQPVAGVAALLVERASGFACFPIHFVQSVAGKGLYRTASGRGRSGLRTHQPRGGGVRAPIGPHLRTGRRIGDAPSVGPSAGTLPGRPGRSGLAPPIGQRTGFPLGLQPHCPFLSKL
ncbi:hypothetical protein JOS77_23550 [Chromobacterium haemolyticum]|nr:hypothetical protein JOS77_23550 [Chromobacterium haemolyticum]